MGETAQWLIEQNAAIASTDKDGNTPLHKLLSRFEAVEICQLLLERKAKVDSQNQDIDMVRRGLGGCTPLHMAMMDPEQYKALMDSIKQAEAERKEADAEIQRLKEDRAK